MGLIPRSSLRKVSLFVYIKLRRSEMLVAMRSGGSYNFLNLRE